MIFSATSPASSAASYPNTAFEGLFPLKYPKITLPKSLTLIKSRSLRWYFFAVSGVIPPWIIFGQFGYAFHYDDHHRYELSAAGGNTLVPFLTGTCFFSLSAEVSKFWIIKYIFHAVTECHNSFVWRGGGGR